MLYTGECAQCVYLAVSTERNPTAEDAHLSTKNWNEPYVCTITGLLSGTKYHVRAYALRGLEYYYGDDKSFTTEKDSGGGGELNGHNYVDLGLPSGTLWATCNLGANAPEEYGDYYAWGETQTKSIYNWSTYKYCNGGHGWNTLTKYCDLWNCGYNGFTDNLTTLEPIDDAARANWGNEWCIPTREQWEELNQNTISQNITQYGVNGRLYTAENGNTLFLPAAGHRLNAGASGRGGEYWSNTLSPILPCYAWTVSFSSGRSNVVDGNRHYGKSVRAVRSSRQN